MPRESEPRDANGTDSGNYQPPTVTYPQGWTTGYLQSGLCRYLPLSRYVCQGRRKDYVDDIIVDLAYYRNV